jgi:hypothetical protein
MKISQFHITGMLPPCAQLLKSTDMAHCSAAAKFHLTPPSWSCAHLISWPTVCASA